MKNFKLSIKTTKQGKMNGRGVMGFINSLGREKSYYTAPRLVLTKVCNLSDAQLGAFFCFLDYTCSNQVAPKRIFQSVKRIVVYDGKRKSDK